MILEQISDFNTAWQLIKNIGTLVNSNELFSRLFIDLSTTSSSKSIGLDIGKEVYACVRFDRKNVLKSAVFIFKKKSLFRHDNACELDRNENSKLMIEQDKKITVDSMKPHDVVGKRAISPK